MHHRGIFDRSQSTIANVDPEIWAAIQAENRRQEEHIELIASENYTSPAVMAAQGSQLTNKYAEGYPGKRYYGGCEYVDVVEQLAIERARQIFGAEFANVQPNSGSQANQGVFLPTASRAPQCIYTNRSYDHNSVFVHCGAQDFTVALNGDKTQFVHATTPPTGLLTELHRLRMGQGFH